MKKRAVLISVVVFCAMLSSVGLVAQKRSDLPAPRAPKRYRVTKVEQLLPNARVVVRRPFSWMAGGQYGLGLKKGEKLLIVGGGLDPLIVQAIVVAADEIGVTADVITKDLGVAVRRAGREEFDYQRFNPATYMATSAGTSRALPGWLAAMVENYDVVLNFTARGTHYGKIIGKNKTVRSAGLLWTTAEQFASPAVSYPDELFGLIAAKGWQMMINGKKFRITDPMGTDISFTLDQTSIERFKETRGMSTFGEKSLDQPLANESSLQVEPQLSAKPDGRGVLVTKQVGLMPLIKIYFEGGQITRVEGGGAPGENIRGVLERFKNTQFPGYYPGPGVGWLEELALGTHPKVGPAGPLRHRSGLIQLAFGTDRHNTVTDQPPSLPPNHRDMDLFYYPTLEIDGKKLVDRGRLTVLDDPEVRKVAAKYGNPDELLREDWIPEYDEESGRILFPPYEDDKK